VPARFGYDAFKIDLKDITPGPVGEGYELSPGDKVHLRVWGELQLTFELVVSDDQYLEIPDVPGRVYVGSLTLADVADRLRRHLATAYATFFDLDNPAASAAFVDVALSDVREIRFLVQGEVGTPGSYSLHPSLGNLIYALARAGGVKESGSLRNIRIRRADATAEVDFYEFLMQGTVADRQLRIRNGDVIFVPLKRKEVTIQGEVRRPGIYTLRETGSGPAEDLETLLEFAGGVLPSASTDRLLILRTEMNVGRRTLTINLDTERQAKRRVLLQDQDVIKLVSTNALRRDFVSLKGTGVLVPGEYQFLPGMRISTLLSSAGGLMPEAYLERAELRRMGADMRTAYVQVNLRMAAENHPDHNIPVQPLDELIVYTRRDIEGLDGSVTLRGHVRSGGPVPLSVGMKLSDLLFARAGLQDQDFMRDTYLARADLIRIVPGTTRRQLITFDLGKILKGDPAEDRILQADDEVVVYDRKDILGTDRFVTLSGHFKTQGRHNLLQGMRLVDLLRGTGGYDDPDFRRQAYLPRGEVWRTVERDNRLVRELHRFDLGALLMGDAALNIELQSGDEVVLYAARDFAEAQTVELTGAVNKPGSYELAANMTIGDLIIRGGGLKELADPVTADLFRVAVGANGGVTLESLQVQLEDATFALRNRDRILVRTRAGYQPSRVVQVTGQVQFPGPYTLDAGGRIADVVRMAGGLLDGAFLDGAALRRGGAEGSRIVFDLERALAEARSTDNLLLENGDTLDVPRRSNTITVIDEVLRPITIAFAEGQGVKYYLQAAGGLTAGANPDAVAVLLPSGRYAPKRFLRGPEIVPGSTIVVPPKIVKAPVAAPAPVIIK
jgi:protein involved in polysaccharide export with SLBB domain